MDSRNEENLRDLFEKFMDVEQAQNYAEDIEKGEQILRDHPAPEPDDMLLANIKANIALHKLPHKVISFKKKVYEALAIAAAIAIIATISLHSINDTPLTTAPPETASLLPAGWWTGEDQGYTEILNNYNNINSQIKQIEANSEYDDTFVFDEFENQIQELENRLYNIGNSEEEYNYTNSNSRSIIEDLENRINEINNSFWQNDYSSTESFEI